MSSPLEKCIALCGSQTELGRRVVNFHAQRGISCKVEQSHVWNWLNKYHGIVPADHVLAVCSSADWKVTPHELRPDIYPHHNDGLPAEMRQAA